VVKRLSPAWRLNYAQALAAQGDLDKAEAQVEAAYAENPALKDGYARIGWQAYWQKKDYGKVKEWMEKDLSPRITPMDANEMEKSEARNTQARRKPEAGNPKDQTSVPPCPPAQRVVKEEKELTMNEGSPTVRQFSLPLRGFFDRVWT
jgi:tetratricopeptide (TPR) repeat protein